MTEEESNGRLLWILVGVLVLWAIFTWIFSGSAIPWAPNYLMLNTLFTGLAFGGALINIFIQMKIIVKQKKDGDKRRFEDLFYNILKIHNDITNQLNTDPAGKNLKGRACFTWFYNKMFGYLDDEIKRTTTNLILSDSANLDSSIFDSIKTFAVTRDFNWSKAEPVATFLKSNPNSSVTLFQERYGSFGRVAMSEYFRIFLDNENEMILYSYFESKFRELGRESRLKIIQDAYENFFEDNEHEIGYYFRNLFYSLQFLRHSAIKGAISGFEEEHFSKILRAGLSKFEIIMIYYNCLTKHSSQEFNELVERYHLIDEIEKRRYALYEDDATELFKMNSERLKGNDAKKG